MLRRWFFFQFSSMLKFVCWCDVNLYFFLWGSACADRYIDDMRFTICKNAVEKCGCVCVCACVCVREWERMIWRYFWERFCFYFKSNTFEFMGTKNIHTRTILRIQYVTFEKKMKNNSWIRNSWILREHVQEYNSEYYVNSSWRIHEYNSCILREHVQATKQFMNTLCWCV